MIEKEILDKIRELINNNKILFEFHAEIDIIKQGYNWSKEFIVECLRNGKKYVGAELYPSILERKNRYYCIHKYSVLSSKLILISFLVLDNLVVIHIQPLNPGSKEGRIYYNS